jgi:hypothetical protein
MCHPCSMWTMCLLLTVYSNTPLEIHNVSEMIRQSSKKTKQSVHVWITNQHLFGFSHLHRKNIDLGRPLAGLEPTTKCVPSLDAKHVLYQLTKLSIGCRITLLRHLSVQIEFNFEPASCCDWVERRCDSRYWTPADQSLILGTHHRLDRWSSKRTETHPSPDSRLSALRSPLAWSTISHLDHSQRRHDKRHHWTVKNHHLLLSQQTFNPSDLQAAQYQAPFWFAIEQPCFCG